MKPTFFATLAVVTIIGLATAGFSAAQDITTVYYPNEDDLEFTVEVPSDWTMTPQGEEGAEDYFEVEGPNGLELSFRTIPGKSIDKAIDDHFEYLTENFSDVEIGDTVETTINGLEAILAPGTGKDADGVEREFGAGWFFISDKVVGELWYNVAAKDSAGADAAITVLNSLSGPE